MKTRDKIFIALAIIAVFMNSFFLIRNLNKKTPEQIEAETKRTIQLKELKQAEVELEHKRALEAAQVRAQIQANKPVEVQVQEQKTDTGEAIVGAAAIGGGVYLLSKFFDVMSQ